MSNLLAMLATSGNALDVYQQALSVVQNNVNNASTPGYARQSLNLEAQPLDVADGLAGGVAAAGLDNSRDQYAEEQVQRQTQALGQYTAQANATGTIQSFFDASGSSGVSAALRSLLQAFSAWSVTPGGKPSAPNSTSPPKLARLAEMSVANRLPRATTMHCRDWVSLRATSGIFNARLGDVGVTSMR